jgi:hypothetical protein
MKPKSLMAIIAALAMIMLLATTTVADHTIPLGASGTDQSGECTGDYFKVEDAGVLVEGTHTYTGTTSDGGAFSVTLTVVFDDEDEVDSITVVAIDPGYDLIVVKAGTEFFTTDGASITPGNGKAISNIAFCLTEETTTTSSTDTTSTATETTDTETTATETTDTTSTATETTDTTSTATETTDTTSTATETTDTTSTDTETTDTTSTDTETTDTTSTDTETTDTETTPEGEVEELTPPSTDTLAQPSGSATVSTGVLLVLAGLLSAALVVIPAAARRRR